MRLRPLLPCLVTAACGAAPVERGLDARLTGAEAMRDVAVLEAALTEGMPLLHRYRDRAQVDSAFRALADTVRDGVEMLDFWRLLSRTLAYVGDAHLSVAAVGPVVTAVYQSPGRVLPVKFGVVEDRLYILRNYASPERMPDGSLVLAVGERSGEQFLEYCLDHISRDQGNRTRGYRLLEREFQLSCAPVLGLPDRYVIRFLAPDGVEGVDTVRTMSWRARRDLVVARDSVQRPAANELRFIGGDVALLAVRSFSKSDDFDPQLFFRSSFERIAASGVQTLILDVRENGGGRDGNGAELFSWVARDTFEYAERLLARRRFSFLEGTADWHMNWLIGLTISTVRGPDGLLRLQESLDRPQAPKRGAFAGRLVVLADRSTYSTASEVVALVQHHRRGMVVGEPVANARAGDSGATVSLPLPASGFVVNVPLVAYRLPGWESTPRGAAVVPDVLVRPTIAELMAGGDLVMEAALRTLR